MASVGYTVAAVHRAEPEDVYKLIAWRPRDRLDIQDVVATARAAGVELDWQRITGWAVAWEVADRLDEARREAGA